MNGYAHELGAWVIDTTPKAFWVSFLGLADYDQKQHGATAWDKECGPGNGPEK